LDVHRAQITFDVLDEGTGEVERGRIRATPEAVRVWAARFAGEEIHVAVEACTGWLFVCEALAEAGAVPHLAEPVETSALRGKKRRAKTDREDARWLRTLLCEGRLPEAWIPPAHVREWRTRARLRKTLVDERTSWLQRVQATLFHHGVGGVPDKLLSAQGREFLAALELPEAARERIEVALQVIEALDRQLAPLEQALRQLARRQTGCRALMRHYGIGELTAATILCELGDVTRLSASRKAVRCAGLDIGVHRSDRRSRAGKLTRQGSPQLRWALYESAQAACRPTSPDRADYLALKARGLSHTRRVADDRAQARAALLPHAARARPRRLGTSHLTLHRSVPPSPPVPDGTHSSGRLPQTAATPAHRRRSTKDRAAGVVPRGSTHRPSRRRPNAEHPDKPGRPRNDRNHTTPQPLAPNHLTEAPIQISGTPGFFALSSAGRRLRKRVDLGLRPVGAPALH
jgi:transposase